MTVPRHAWWGGYRARNRQGCFGDGGGQGSGVTATNPGADAQRHHLLNPTPTPQTTGKQGEMAGTDGNA